MTAAPLFASWNDLLNDAEQLRSKASDHDDFEAVHDLLAERLDDLSARQCQLDDPHAPDEKLLLKCQEDINERMYGTGIRTYEQTMAVHEKANG